MHQCTSMTIHIQSSTLNELPKSHYLKIIIAIVISTYEYEVEVNYAGLSRSHCCIETEILIPFKS